MLKMNLVIVALLIVVGLYSCSKKNHPVRSLSETIEKDSSSLLKKAPAKKKPKEAVPKVITVTDNIARKSVDGRYYYDLQGHRYWRNNKDGKYYLFNKSMYNNGAFKKPD